MMMSVKETLNFNFFFGEKKVLVVDLDKMSETNSILPTNFHTSYAICIRERIDQINCLLSATYIYIIYDER